MATEKLDIMQTIKDGVRYGLKNFFPLLLMVILYVVTVWIPYLNVGTTIGLYKAIIGIGRGQTIDPTSIFDKENFKNLSGFFLLLGLVYIGTVVAFCFMIIPGIVMGIAWGFAMYFFLDKKVSPLKALQLSYDSTYGNKWRIFAIGIILGIVLSIVSCLLVLIPAVLNLGHKLSQGPGVTFARTVVGRAPHAHQAQGQAAGNGRFPLFGQHERSDHIPDAAHEALCRGVLSAGRGRQQLSAQFHAHVYVGAQAKGERLVLLTGFILRLHAAGDAPHKADQFFRQQAEPQVFLMPQAAVQPQPFRGCQGFLHAVSQAGDPDLLRIHFPSPFCRFGEGSVRRWSGCP